MTSEPQGAAESHFDVSEEEVDRNLSLCGGNARETIRQLLVGQAYLERRISGLMLEASRGYGRGRALPAGRPGDAREAG